METNRGLPRVGEAAPPLGESSAAAAASVRAFFGVQPPSAEITQVSLQDYARRRATQLQREVERVAGASGAGGAGSAAVGCNVFAATMMSNAIVCGSSADGAMGYMNASVPGTCMPLSTAAAIPYEGYQVIEQGVLACGAGGMPAQMAGDVVLDAASTLPSRKRAPVPEMKPRKMERKKASGRVSLHDLKAWMEVSSVPRASLKEAVRPDSGFPDAVEDACKDLGLQATPSFQSAAPGSPVAPLRGPSPVCGDIPADPPAALEDPPAALDSFLEGLFSSTFSSLSVSPKVVRREELEEQADSAKEEPE